MRVSVGRVRWPVARHTHSLKRNKVSAVSVQVFLGPSQDTPRERCRPTQVGERSEKRRLAQEGHSPPEEGLSREEDSEPYLPGSNIDLG